MALSGRLRPGARSGWPDDSAEHPYGVCSDGITEVNEFNDVDASLAALYLRDKGLRDLQRIGDVDLSQSGRHTRVLQRADQGAVFAAVSEGGHGRSDPGRPRN